MSIAVRLLVHFRADFKQKRELLTQYYPSFGVPATIFITILHLSISFPFFPENLSPRRFHNWTRAPTGWPMRRSKGKCSICFRSQPIFSSFLPVRTCIFFAGMRSLSQSGPSFPTSPLWVYSLSFLSYVKISKVHEIPTEWLLLGYLAATLQWLIVVLNPTTGAIRSPRFSEFITDHHHIHRRKSSDRRPFGVSRNTFLALQRFGDNAVWMG